jgi:formiminoglutamase
MKKLVLFTPTDQKKIVNKRTGEIKFGEQIQLITDSTSIYDQLIDLDVTYVIFGIPEDIGVFANNGKSGTYNTYFSALKVLLNTQANAYNSAKKVLLLGHLNFSQEQNAISKMNPAKSGDHKKARVMVSEMDKYVTELVQIIVNTGKKPIIIGGGHNNAYGNIKGAALALKSPINTINLDAHTDFNMEEGRHNGNGFTYAYNEGFLDKYFIFSIHENYISQHALNTINRKSKRISFNTFESLFVRKELKFVKECNRALQFIKNKPFGIEIDCDAIENIPGLAMSPTGLSVQKSREFLNLFAKEQNAIYLHICGASPELAPKKMIKLTSKLISYLITDFIRANQN